ncbi:MAG: leucine-rich repeat protein [Clostridia bacterium]|nr:leucine-rich repeat protein [Lachnospiraceae bacterium]MBQ7592244.1 leucine-rich repeat protein [Clostridia bacterium]
MKKKLFIVAVCIFLVLSGVGIGVLIHAEESAPELNIAKCTLSLESNTYIVYAVQGDISSDVRLLIWNRPQSSYEKGTEDTVLTPVSTFSLLGVDSLRFEYTKLAAKQMGDVVYARAAVEKNGQYYYSDIKQYSILQYIYEKTGRTGDDPYPDDNLIKLLNSMIVYGANAQSYFNYKTDRLVDEDHYWVKVVGGTLGDLCTDGLYLPGDEITLIAPETDASGKIFESWTDGDGIVIGTSATTIITVGEANETYTANYTEPAPQIPESQGLAYVDNGDETCTITGIGECGDSEIYIPKTINGLTVKAVGEEAFKENTSVTYVYMPDSITLIDKKAFYGCTGLGEVTLPGDTQATAASGIQNTFPTFNAEIKAIKTGKKSALNTKAGGAGNRGETGEELIIGEAAFQNCTSLESITIPDNVTSIGDSAFQFCSGLTNVNIPESVVTIGESAFQECTNLESIILPDGLTTIGESAFYGCSSLKSMEIPEGTTTICGYAFWGCDFERVVIPSTVTQIEHGAFAGCDKIIELVVSENNSVYYSVDNCIIHKDTKSLILGCKGSTIPSDGSILSISDAAFEGNKYITNIIIPEGVVEIADSAFRGCKNLDSIELPESLVLIGEFAFDSINITTLTIPDAVTHLGSSAFGSCERLETVILGSGLQEIGASAFKWCNSLSSISIPGNVYSIGEEAFEGCANLATVILEDGVQIIGESAFAECQALTSFAIPKTVASIGKTAFGRCDGIETIIIDTDNPYYVFTNNCLIEIASKKVLQGFGGFVIPDDGSVENIEDGAFEGNSAVVEIIIPSDVVSIGERAFADCNNLAYINVPDSVTVIGPDAFSGCSALESINIPCSLSSIMNGTFCGCESLTVISIPEGVTTIGDQSFRNCINLAEIQLPQSVTALGSQSFSECRKLVKIYYSGTVEGWDAIEKGRDFDSGSGYYTVYATDGESHKQNLFAYRDNGDGTCAIIDVISVIETDSSFEIPSQIKGLTVVSIDSMGGLRFDCTAGVIIPDTVQRIGEGAFDHLVGLASIVIPDSVSYIGGGAFNMCNLSDVYIGKGVTYIGPGAFTNCPLESIAVSDDNPCYFSSGNCIVETNTKKLIVAGANCVIPDDGSVTTICEDAFSGVMRRRREEITIVIPSCVTTIEKGAFHGCEVANIVISNGVTNIGKEAFDWTELHRIIIPSSVTQLGDGAFSGNGNLYSAVLCEGITEKGINIFGGCDELKKIYYSGSIENWNEFARTEEFSSDSPEVICGITEYNDSFFVLKDNRYSFIAANGNATEFEIASTVNGFSVSGIEDYAFINNIDLRSLTIPESVESIGCLAFKGCVQLEDIYFTGTAKQWCSIAFGDGWDDDTGGYRVYCSDMVLNKGDECGLTYIINNDFEENPGIKITGSLFSDISQLVIPKSIAGITVTEIAEGSFEGYADLTTVFIPDTVVLIGNSAFEGCAALTSVTMAGSSSHFLSIGENAFKGCGSLSNITLPGSVNSIGNSAFENCIGLSEIVLPYRINLISGNAFAGCSGLQSITVYSLVKSISENAFNGCDNLSSVHYDGNETEWEQITVESGNDPLNSAFLSFGRFYGSPIASAEEFYSITNDVYYLVNDISLTESKESFGGILNGNGHAIYLENGPAFNLLENAIISNLTIRGTISSYELRLGALACRAYNVIIYNVINYANITNDSCDGNLYIGGIIGSIETNNATENNRQTDYFINCINYGNIMLNMLEGTPRIGGIVGNAARWQWCVYDNCKNYGRLEVNVNDDSVSPYVGGIAGSAFGADFINCENGGELRSQNSAYMGGIIARPTPSCNGGSQTVTCTGCINNGDIYCSTDDSIGSGTAGGIIGHAGAKDNNRNTFAVYACINCVNNGSIICGGNYVGGIIGYAYGIDKVDDAQETYYQYAYIEGCTNNGNITGTKTVEQNENGSNWEATFVSQFLGFANTCSNVIINSKGYGSLVNTNNNYNVIFGISSDPDCVSNSVIYGITLLENEGTTNFNWCSDNKALGDREANRVSLEDYLAIEGNGEKIVFVDVPEE